MRALLFTLLLAVPASPAIAQTKAAPKPAAPAVAESRYFTALDGFMDGAEVILKETRQGKAVTAAVLDVCYPAAKGSDRKERFVATLTASGQTLTGATQTLGGQESVAVKLIRKPNGATFDFAGTINVGSASYEVASSDNSDLSEKEFEETQHADDGIAPAPADFTAVSPEAVGVRVDLEAAADFLKTLRGQNVEVSLSSLAVGCDALRAGKLVINLAVDPERAAAVIAKAKAFPGVTTAGWTHGVVDMDRTILFPAAGWRDGGKLNRDRIATTLTGAVSQTLSAKPVSANWSDDTGKLKMIFKRPSAVFPALQLTETIEIEALVGPDKPGGSDKLMLWLGHPTIATADENASPRLALNDDLPGEEEAEPRSDGGAIAAVAKELKGQRWDSESSTWQ